MPNGNPNFATEELPALETFFRPLTPTLERFATKHNLMIERYYHDLPAWHFRFRHPCGGEAYLEVRRAAEQAVSLGKAWWQDDYERAPLSTKMHFSDPTPLDSIDLYSTLAAALREVLHWRAGSWDHVHTGYESIWHRTWSTHDFNALVDRLPKPVLPNET